MADRIRLPLLRPSRAVTLAGQGLSVVLALLGALLGLLLSERLAPFFAVAGFFLGAILGIFLGSLFSKVASLGSHLEIEGSRIALTSRAGRAEVDLSRPFEIRVTRGEGDHKERGGLVLLSLGQGGASLQILGELGRQALSEACEAALVGAEEAPLLKLVSATDAPGTHTLAGEGEICLLLEAVGKVKTSASPESA